MNFNKKLQLAYFRMRTAKNILLIGHINPDADALSSMGAIMEIILHLKINVSAYAAKKIDNAYTFIPHSDQVKASEPRNLLSFDLIIVLDCGSIARTNLKERLIALIKAEADGRLSKRPYIIEFDHHQSQDSYADLEIRLPDKASTTEIIYYFLQVNGIEISKTLANCILTGLLTDTGNFLYSNSSYEAIAIASEMLLRGASLPKIIAKTINNKSFSALKIWGRILENTRLTTETGLAVSALTNKELSEVLSPLDEQDDSNIFGDVVSFLSNLQGVKIALLLREEGDYVKGSLRTKDNELDVARIANNWGGGGHKKAAGFRIKGKLALINNSWTVI